MTSRLADRPNILVVLSDDQGYWSLGCTGNEEARTPNLDRLALQGTMLTRFYCASPVCSPARASLLTGRMPSAHGVHDFLRPERPGAFPTRDHLEGFTTTPDVLARSGWHCGLSGKWHLGTDGRAAHGFAHLYAHAGGQGPYNAAPMWRDGELVVERGYVTTSITDDALSFLDQQAESDEPFYLSVHYTAPHSPWVGEHPAELVSGYADCDFRSCVQRQPHPWWSAPSAAIAEAMRDPYPSLRGYFAAVTAMDREIGRLLGWLDRAGVRRSTLVVFLADNGFSCGHHGIWGKGNSTWPLNVFEESINVPAIVSQPDRIPTGATYDGLLSGCDLHPTLLDAANVSMPADPWAAGSSFLPVVSEGGRVDGARDHVVVYDEYGDTRMVRTPEWKYVDRSDGGPEELYDLRDDPEEMTNLASDPDRRAVRRELRTLLHDWFMAHTDPDRDPRGAGVSGAGQRTVFSGGTPGAQAFYPRIGLNPGY